MPTLLNEKKYTLEEKEELLDVILKNKEEYARQLADSATYVN